MGDEKRPNESDLEEPDAESWEAAAAASVAPPPVSAASTAASVPPRPVSAAPRPVACAPPPPSRMPPPPSSRGLGPGALRSTPPPVPPRPTSSDSLAARPSVVPRAPATPPPLPPRPPSSPQLVRPLTSPPASAGALTQLEQRLATTQIELRKLGTERHTLRARLKREADRVRELESALRAEKQLRQQATDEHQAALAGLRARLAELDAEKTREVERLSQELAQARAAQPTGNSAPSSAGKVVTGLRRIRGVGPAYQRALEQLGVTEVEQIAAWSEDDVAAFAEKLRIRPERIKRDDWVGQARLLCSGS